jgi:hypothetical protein
LDQFAKVPKFPKNIWPDVHQEVEVAGRGTIIMTHASWEKVDLEKLISLNLDQFEKVPKFPKKIGPDVHLEVEVAGRGAYILQVITSLNLGQICKST